MVKIGKGDLKSSTKFKEKLKGFIENQIQDINKRYGIQFEFDELGDLILSLCRIVQLERGEKLLF